MHECRIKCENLQGLFKVRNYNRVIERLRSVSPDKGAYADVQIMLDGGEAVYYCDIEGLKEVVPYKDDIVFYENAGQPISISQGMFYVAFPQDGHMPCRTQNQQPEIYRKNVLKIKL